MAEPEEPTSPVSHPVLDLPVPWEAEDAEGVEAREKAIREEFQAITGTNHDEAYKEEDVTFDRRVALAVFHKFGVTRLTQLLSPQLDDASRRSTTRVMTVGMFMLLSGVEYLLNAAPDINCIQFKKYFAEEIDEWLTNHVLPTVKGLHGEVLLTKFVVCWESHLTFTESLRRLLPLDQSRFSFGKEVLRFRTLMSYSLLRFKQLVFDGTKTDIAATLQALINKDRSGEMVDRALLKQAIRMFLIMGVAEDTKNFRNRRAVLKASAAPQTGTAKTYEQDFQAPFLAGTRTYYLERHRDWFSSNSTSDYLKLVQEAIAKESARVDLYLNAATLGPLLRLMYEVLVESCLHDLLTPEASESRGIRPMLDRVSSWASMSSARGDTAGERATDEDLDRLYSLLRHTNGGSEALAKAFQKHVEEVGKAKVQRRYLKSKRAEAGEGGKKGKKLPALDVEYVDDMMLMYQTFEDLCKREFGRDSSVMKAYHTAMVAVLREMPGNAQPHTEVLAAFIDHALTGRHGKKKLTNDAEVAGVVDAVLSLFNFFVDKDEFRDFYREHLSRRLLGNKSCSTFAEKAAVSTLKDITHSQMFTSRIEGMITDFTMTQSKSEEFVEKDKTKQVEEGAAAGSVVEFRPFVLKTGNFPPFFKLSPDFTLPPEMAACVFRFAAHYKADKANNNRCLRWAHSQGSGQVRIEFDAGWVNVTGTTLQVAVLMMFRQKSSFKLEELKAALGLSIDDLKRIIAPMALSSTGKILALTPAEEGGDGDGKEGEAGGGAGAGAGAGAAPEPRSKKRVVTIKSTDTVSVNFKFKSRVKNITVRPQVLAEKRDRSGLKEERFHVMDAAIVRIMKTRKVLSHPELVSQSINQIRFFRPTPKDIKRRIHSLIEREFLRRQDPTSLNSPYEYVAE